MADLKLTHDEFGFLGSSFFFLFAVAGVAGGFLANRVKTKNLLFGMALVWSLVQFPMLATVTIETLIVCRIILGAGEGPAAPVAFHALYKWFPDSLRGVPTALVAQGSALGVIVEHVASGIEASKKWPYAPTTPPSSAMDAGQSLKGPLSVMAEFSSPIPLYWNRWMPLFRSKSCTVKPCAHGNTQWW